MPAAERVSWRNPRVLVTLLLVFLAGALAGAIAMRSPLHAKLHANASQYWGDDRNEFSYDTLNRELKLSPEQSERLKTILDDFVKYHDDLEAQIEDVRATGRNRIRQILDPRQQQRFEELCKQLPPQ
jgi:Spy/CpxP family protein refolding chaperone